MKKALVFMGTTLAVFCACQAFAYNGPKIQVDGRQIETDAFIEDGTTYVPVRAVSEMLGAAVDWDAGSGTVLISSNGSAQQLPGIIERLSPSVVGIIGNRNSDAASSYQDKYSEGIVIGTGVVVKAGGEILTNAHVVKDLYNIIVVLYDGSGYQARVKYIDEATDLAVVKIDKLGLTVAPLAEAGDVTVGESVVALGTPLSMSLRNSATSGIVSGLNRAVSSDYSLIQTDASINAGNSGGPLINMHGEVIGINSSKFTGVGIEGVCFAIPMGTVRYVLNHFDTYGRVRRPDIGAQLTEDWVAAYGLPTQNGLTVKSMENGKSAQAAGLAVGDMVMAVDGRQVRSLIDWNETMTRYLPEQTVTLTVMRGGETMDVNVILGEK